MKLIVALCSLLAAARAASTDADCTPVCYQGHYHDEVLLKSGLDTPSLLAVDYATDTLYFNYNVAAEEWRSARLNLRTQEFQDIEGIRDGFSHAVDSKNSLLYIGTRNGIHVYNLKTNQSNFHGARGYFIWSLFFKDEVFYFSEFPSQRLYTYSNGGVVKKFKELEHTAVHFFLMDNDNDMFFSNGTGLYKQVRGTADAVLYETIRHPWDIRALTRDLSGNVYAGLFDGVYSVNRHEPKIENILARQDLSGLTFDGDNNVIYATDMTCVVQLKRSKENNNNCTNVEQTRKIKNNN